MHIGGPSESFVDLRMRMALNKDGDLGVSLDELAPLLKTKAAAEAGFDAAAAQEFFSALDTDGDGCLAFRQIKPSDRFSAETLHAMLDEVTGNKSRGFNLDIADTSLVSVVQDRMLSRMDADRDGGLSLAEFSALRSAPPTGDDEAGKTQFATLDANGDGKLVAAELRGSKAFAMTTFDAMLRRQAGDAPVSGPPETVAGWFIGQGDADADGVLSAEEFAKVGPQGVISGLGQSISRNSWDFAHIDRDHDGELTAAEVTQQLDGKVMGLITPINVGGAERQLLAGASAAGGLSEADLAALGGAADARAALDGLDADRDGRLSRAELGTALARRLDFYQTGVLHAAPINGQLTLDFPSQGEIALARMLHHTLARLDDAFLGAPGSTQSATA